MAHPEGRDPKPTWGPSMCVCAFRSTSFRCGARTPGKSTRCAPPLTSSLPTTLTVDIPATGYWCSHSLYRRQRCRAPGLQHYLHTAQHLPCSNTVMHRLCEHRQATPGQIGIRPSLGCREPSVARLDAARSSTELCCQQEQVYQGTFPLAVLLARG